MSIFFPDYYPCSAMQVLEHYGSSFFDQIKCYRMETVLLGDGQNENVKKGISNIKKGLNHPDYYVYEIKDFPYQRLQVDVFAFARNLFSFLSYYMPLCITNGFFYFKKYCFIFMAFKCLSLKSEGLKSIGVQSKREISPCEYVR